MNMIKTKQEKMITVFIEHANQTQMQVHHILKSNKMYYYYLELIFKEIKKSKFNIINILLKLYTII